MTTESTTVETNTEESSESRHLVRRGIFASVRGVGKVLNAAYHISPANLVSGVVVVGVGVGGAVTGAASAVKNHNS